MATFAVLNPSARGDRGRWLEAWGRSPQREPAAHPVYAELFAQPDEEARAALYSSPYGELLFPFILRDLARPPWNSPGLKDVATPYGYGGPFAWKVRDGNALARAFWSELDTWLIDHAVVTLFARVPVVDDSGLTWPDELRTVSENVVRRLDRPVEEIWREYRHKVRKNVNTAQRHGLEFEFDSCNRRLPDFVAIYQETMDRAGADGFYRFPRWFFERLAGELPENALLFHALHEGDVMATELVLASRWHLYSFLGGTRASALPVRANDFLKHEIIRWGTEHGKKSYVLGGGVRADDGIFRYKKAFAPGGVVPFRVAHRILDRHNHDRLLERRVTWEQQRDRDWQPRPDYFPGYRA